MREVPEPVYKGFRKTEVWDDKLSKYEGLIPHLTEDWSTALHQVLKSMQRNPFSTEPYRLTDPAAILAHEDVWRQFFLDGMAGKLVEVVDSQKSPETTEATPVPEDSQIPTWQRPFLAPRPPNTSPKTYDEELKSSVAALAEHLKKAGYTDGNPLHLARQHGLRALEAGERVAEDLRKLLACERRESVRKIVLALSAPKTYRYSFHLVEVD